MKPISAYVVASTGDDFTCKVDNLTPRSLLLQTDRKLAFRTSVSVTFFSVEVTGEVALTCEQPRGLLVVFHASDDVRARIADHIRRLEERIPVVQTKPLGTPVLPDPTDVADVPLDPDELTFQDDTGEVFRGLTSTAAVRTPSTMARPPEPTKSARPVPQVRAIEPVEPVEGTTRPMPKKRATKKDENITELDMPQLRRPAG